ncbi:MAG: peptidoglycan D,D-transpeptidase FtsI family protein [Rubricella sp.]
MIRVPLRPLARIITAREQGRDPDLEEAERRASALRARRARERSRSANRLVMVAGVIALAYGAVATQMTDLALSTPEPLRSAHSADELRNARADIVDRNGMVLATNLPVASLFAESRQMVDPLAAAEGLARVFPDLDADTLYERFTGPGNFHWIRDTISPEEAQAVHDLGQPGLFLGDREMRIYPAGRPVAHLIGGARFERLSADGAEIIGIAGVEHGFESRLSDPGSLAEPLALSIDLRVQAAMRDVLVEEMERFDARGAAGILMDPHTGEIVAMVSLPDFDPNDRPLASGYAGDSPLFSRAAQGVYELGSTFKPFQAAIAMEAGVATPSTMIDTRAPLRWGRFAINDVHRMGPELSLHDVIVRSSNVGTARLAQLTGIDAQRAFFQRLGFLEPTGLELPEAGTARPILPERWSEISMMTISYGHGLSVSPVHLAAGYAAIANGGLRVEPTLVAGARPPGEESRVMREQTTAALRAMMRDVVAIPEGTANFAEVPGFEVAGKTGTAEKPVGGGYAEDAVISTFAGFFPASDPAYVLVVTLDEPEDRSGPVVRRTAGWTAAPASANVIRRIAPILGLRPRDAAPMADPDGVTLVGFR